MNIICERENCKFRKINNSMQNLNICGKETARIGTTGRCKSFEKLQPRPQKTLERGIDMASIGR